MVELAIGGGVVVDLATRDDTEKIGAQLVDEFTRRANTGKPFYQTLWAANSTPGSGATTTILRFGKPPAGRVWNLVYLTITGPDDHTAVAGATVASYVGDPDNPTLHGLVDPANGTTVPNSASFSKDEIWVHDGEELFVIVYGAPINTQLSGVARVLSYVANELESTRS